MLLSKRDERVGKKTMQQVQLYKQGRQRNSDDFTLYNENTEPMLPTATAPLPSNHFFLRESWLKRFLRAVGNFIAAVIRKINQLLALALAGTILLLTGRFLLTFFALKTSLFAQWIYWLSEPFILPFNHFLPTQSYDGYFIDASTLVAIIAYTIVIVLIRQFLKLFIPRRLR
jgi:uncharacterized protein YggT (Ycf19 family)